MLQHAGNTTTPPCPHFGVCGGCQLQELVYSAQLERKAERLRGLGSFALPELQVHASPPLAYRNRVRLTLREVGGVLRAGYLGDPEDGEKPGRELRFVPITQCPIAAPLLWRAAEAFLRLASDARWLRSAQLTLDQLELFTTADESRLLLTLFVRSAQKRVPAKLDEEFSVLCDRLGAQIPELAGAGLALLPAVARGRRVEQPRMGPVWGAPGLGYTIEPPFEPGNRDLEPLSYWVPRGAFFQANRFLLPKMVTLIARVASAASRKDASAWDLYAGVGLFSRVLARIFTEVTAVEIAEPAATALAQTKIAKLRAVKAMTLDFLRAAVLQRDLPSLIVLDPPRAGLGVEVCSHLARIGAQTLVYVSCSPEALAADLAILTASGYSTDELHLFDLFPQTEHIETVVMLHRV